MAHLDKYKYKYKNFQKSLKVLLTQIGLSLLWCLLNLFNNLTEDVVWENPVPSSCRFCRPISIEFNKETPKKTKAVLDEIKCQIISLKPIFIIKEDKKVEVKHELFPTMIDGKVAQVLTDTTSSASTCTICGADPCEMNDLTKVIARPENEDSYQYAPKLCFSELFST